ncbi:MAG: zf-TFIIB domain-containing protein [Bdellovibrionota bacterium]|nr:MAG: zf-TFIIB domain-containing protein [Bdellovibrionota bacterium]
MNDSWEDRRRAQEEQYFESQNKAALARLQQRKTTATRACPVEGQPLEQLTMMGVVIDRCPKCGGVWLDGGELEQIITSSKQSEHWSEKFFGTLFKK